MRKSEESTSDWRSPVEVALPPVNQSAKDTVNHLKQEKARPMNSASLPSQLGCGESSFFELSKVGNPVRDSMREPSRAVDESGIPQVFIRNPTNTHYIQG